MSLSEIVTALIALSAVLPQLWTEVEIIYDACLRIVTLTGRAIPGIVLPGVNETFAALSAEDEADLARLQSAMAADGVRAMAADGRRAKGLLDFLRANPWLLQLIVGQITTPKS